jgi:hypothetical protein
MTHPVTVHRYTPANKAEWDSFVAKSNDGTIFHTQQFLSYHPEGKWQFCHLLFRQNNALIAVLPAGINSNGELWSPVGSSYGSIITNDISFERALAIVDVFIDFLRSNNIGRAFLIPPPLIYATITSQHIEYALLYRKATFEHHYISHAVKLDDSKPLMHRFAPQARNVVNKLLRENTIRIQESDDIETFHHILVENKKKHNATPTHSLEDLRQLFRLLPDRLRLTMVYANDIPIAGSLLMLTNANVALCFYNMMLYEYEHFKPVYLIMYDALRWATERGFRWVDIGVSQDTTSSNPMTPALSLIQFKERFGARGVLRSTYQLIVE